MKENPYRFPFTPFPDGIFAVGFSHQLPRQKVRQLTFMGQHLVLFRDEGGQIGALYGYCPHLGANLACGVVKRNTLQCPFHGIRFTRNGNSTTKDFAGNRSYQVQSWLAFEKYGIIFLIHNPLARDVKIKFPEWDLSNWSLPIQYCFKIRSHPQEILENSADLLHFFQVHQYSCARTINPLHTFGTEFTIGYHLERKESIFKWFKQKRLEFYIDIHAYGLGLSHVEISLPTYGLKAKQMVFPTPIDGEFIHIRTLTSLQYIKKIKFLPTWMTPGFVKKKITQYLNNLIANNFLNDFLPDLEIWENKKYIDNPKPLPNEDEIQKYRGWARQFYRLEE